MKIERVDFTSFEAFSEWSDRARENDGDYNVVSIIRENGWCNCDLITTCKSWKTALKRLFKVLPENEFAGWYEDMRETAEAGIFKSNNRCDETGEISYAWEIEWVDENLWYIFLNIRIDENTNENTNENKGENTMDENKNNVNEKTKEETIQEKQDRENREYCKSIAENLSAVVNGEMYRCPDCDENIILTDDNYNDETGEYTCPVCGATIDENDLNQVDLLDYLGDIYDVEYTIGSDKQFRAVRLMVACGGPNVYIDTKEGAVLLYWWTDHARYFLDSDVVDAINDLFEELFNC